MKHLAVLTLLVLLSLTTPGAWADGNAIEIKIVDGQISMDAEAAPLGRLLDLMDRVAGTSSTVPPELANRNVSVQFTNLSLDQSIKKIFEGLPIDYAVLEGNRIVVTDVSTNVSGNASGSSAPTRSASAPQAPSRSAPAANPFQAPGNRSGAAAVPARASAPGGAQPAVIQTPFGPLVNPRAAQGRQAQPGTPMAMPGQGLPFGMTPGGTAGSATNPTSMSYPTGPDGYPITNPAMLEQMRQQQQQQSGPPNILGNTKPPVFENKAPTSTPKGPNPPKPGP